MRLVKVSSIIFALALLLGTAQARFYLGLPGGTAFVAGLPAPVGGLQLGSYGLYEDFGLRGGADIGAVGGALLVSTAIEGIYSLGDTSRFYAGAGVGYVVISGLDTEINSPLVSAVVGGDFDAATAISLFLEVNPHLYLFPNGAQAAVRVRSGINFHIGEVEESDANILTIP